MRGSLNLPVKVALGTLSAVRARGGVTPSDRDPRSCPQLKEETKQAHDNIGTYKYPPADSRVYLCADAVLKALKGLW